MADSRYSKYYSNFILKKKHQQSVKGTIWERDWVTIGDQHQIEPGKRRYFYDGNFLFTDNIMPAHKKWHNFGTTISVWNYDDVAEAKGLVNNVDVNWETYDLRDFAYYGSCTELVRASVEDIIYWFPGRLTKTQITFSLDDTAQRLNEDYDYDKEQATLKKQISENEYNSLNVFGRTSCFNVDGTNETYEVILNSCQYARLGSIDIEEYAKFHMIIDDDISEGEEPITPKQVTDCANDETRYKRITPISRARYNELTVDGKVDFTEVSVDDVTVYEKVISYDDGEDYIIRKVYEKTIGNVIDNSYEIDLYKFNVTTDEYTNELKYFGKFWRKFQVTTKVNETDVSHDINNCFIENRWGTIDCPNENINQLAVHIELDYGENKTLYDVVYVKKLTEEDYLYLGNREKSKCIEYGDGYLFIYKEDLLGKDVCEKKHAKYIVRERYDELSEIDKMDYLQINDNKFVKIIWDDEEYNSLPDNGEKLVIDGYNQNASDIVYVLTSGDFKHIHPKSIYMERFFDKLDVFESTLLTRKTRPLYHAVFSTPFEDEEKEYIYNNVDYIWPSKDGYIEVSGLVFERYLTSLIETATKMDELWCDNMWRNMTHEAIKNYDWTRKQEYIEGDAEEFIAGGERIEQIIHIYGRAFDDIKRYIDGIKFTTNVSYDNINNMPVAELSDKLNFKGWDITSTIPVISDDVTRNALMLSELNLTFTFLNYYIQKQDSTTTDIWFDSLNPEMYNSAQMDVGFLRRLTLASRYILLSKGTKKAIEMVLALFGYGDDDFSISETYHYAYPLVYSTNVSDKINEVTHKIEDSDEDVEYYGVPIEKKKINGNDYLIPCYTNGKTYVDNLYFQSRGGWCGRRNGEDNIIHTETLSYFYSVAKVRDLLSLNSYDLKNGDIYYVIDVSDYAEYTEDIPDDLSHYFILRDVSNSGYFASWDYIIMDSESRDFVQEEYDRAIYLSNIVSTNIGNNPHTGYGEYDSGDEFISKLSDPLETLISSNSITDEEVLAEIDELRNNANDDYPYGVYFNIGKVETESNEDKVKQLADTYRYNLTFNEQKRTISSRIYDALCGEDTKSLFEPSMYSGIQNASSYYVIADCYNKLSKESRKDYKLDEDTYEYVKTITSYEYDRLEEEEQSNYEAQIDEDGNITTYIKIIDPETYDMLINADIMSSNDGWVDYGINSGGNENRIYGQDSLTPVSYTTTIESVSSDVYRRMSSECRSMFIFNKETVEGRFAEDDEASKIQSTVNDIDNLNSSNLRLKDLFELNEVEDEEEFAKYTMTYCYKCFKTGNDKNVSKEEYWGWYEASGIGEQVLIDVDEEHYRMKDYITIDVYNQLGNVEMIRNSYIPVFADSNFVYLNSKVVKIKNNINSDKHIEYFNAVILPYITQVVPSSTILFLENL